MTPQDWYTRLEKLVLQPKHENDAKAWAFIKTFIMPLMEQDFQRRKELGEPSKDMELRRILIKLPPGKMNPIVEINSEIAFEGLIRKTPDVTFNSKGDPVHLCDIQEVFRINRPTHNGKKIPFVYLHYLGTGYYIVSDFTVSDEEERTAADEAVEQTLTEIYRLMIQEKVVRQAANLKSLRKIGLWPVPCLTPYPLNKIIKYIINKNAPEARQLLISYCNFEFIDKRWVDVIAFVDRKSLIQDAIFAHSKGRYRLSICALLPLIEGIISDWLYSLPNKENIPFRQISKTKHFNDLILSTSSVFYFNKVVESTVDFILNGPVLSTFEDWHMKIDNSFPNRNVVEHGKYDDLLFTEENSIKLFLLLDTIYSIISKADYIMKNKLMGTMGID